MRALMLAILLALAGCVPAGLRLVNRGVDQLAQAHGLAGDALALMCARQAPADPGACMAEHGMSPADVRKFEAALLEIKAALARIEAAYPVVRDAVRNAESAAGAARASMEIP